MNSPGNCPHCGDAIAYDEEYYGFDIGGETYWFHPSCAGSYWYQRWRDLLPIGDFVIVTADDLTFYCYPPTEVL